MLALATAWTPAAAASAPAERVEDAVESITAATKHRYGARDALGGRLDGIKAGSLIYYRS